MVIPESIPAIWQKVKKHEALLKKNIEEGNLDKVHKIAFEIRDLVNELAKKSTSLDAENLGNVKSGAERVAAIAKLLDEYGDAGQKDKTSEQFQKLNKALQYIQSQYSNELLEITNEMKRSENKAGVHHEEE